MIKLYDFALSPRVRKVRIVLAEKGLRYEKVNVDLPTARFRRCKTTALRCTSPQSSWSI